MRRRETVSCQSNWENNFFQKRTRIILNANLIWAEKILQIYIDIFLLLMYQPTDRILLSVWVTYTLVLILYIINCIFSSQCVSHMHLDLKRLNYKRIFTIFGFWSDSQSVFCIYLCLNWKFWSTQLFLFIRKSEIKRK